MPYIFNTFFEYLSLSLDVLSPYYWCVLGFGGIIALLLPYYCPHYSLIIAPLSSYKGGVNYNG